MRLAVDDRHPNRASRRVAVARENSWSARLEEMSTLLESAIRTRAGNERGWDHRLRRLYARTQRRTIEIVVSLVLVYLLLFQTPLTWWLAEPLRLDAPPQKADVIAVFAGGGQMGEAGGGYQERTKHAVDLIVRGLRRA